MLSTDPRSLMGTRVCPKGRKHIGGGEAPVYEKSKYIAPTGRQRSRNRKTSPREKFVLNRL